MPMRSDLFVKLNCQSNFIPIAAANKASDDVRN